MTDSGKRSTQSPRSAPTRDAWRPSSPHLCVERRACRRADLAMPAIGTRRRTLHSSWLGCVEDFSAPGDCPPPCGHSPEYQVVLPYAGAFEWHVGAKTLVDLPRCEDFTGLALDLGFSSHAHFSNAFKSLCGVSPSAFRAGCGTPRRAVRMAPGLHPAGAPAHKGGTDLKELKAVPVSARQDGLFGDRQPAARPS